MTFIKTGNKTHSHSISFHLINFTRHLSPLGRKNTLDIVNKYSSSLNFSSSDLNSLGTCIMGLLHILNRNTLVFELSHYNLPSKCQSPFYFLSRFTYVILLAGVSNLLALQQDILSFNALNGTHNCPGVCWPADYQVVIPSSFLQSCLPAFHPAYTLSWISHLAPCSQKVLHHPFRPVAFFSIEW